MKAVLQGIVTETEFKERKKDGAKIPIAYMSSGKETVRVEMLSPERMRTIPVLEPTEIPVDISLRSFEGRSYLVVSERMSD